MQRASSAFLPSDAFLRICGATAASSAPVGRRSVSAVWHLAVAVDVAVLELDDDVLRRLAVGRALRTGSSSRSSTTSMCLAAAGQV